MTHYEILGIALDADFKEIKKAYYRRAKECHPDRHANSKAKEEEFKLVVEAFDQLSDPLKRAQYDRNLNAAAEIPDTRTGDDFMPESVMDTPADDILEELITGNDVPLNCKLATLFQDLSRTEVFMDFREGKNLFYQRRYRAARNFFLRTVEHSPDNILYRCFLARTCALMGDFDRARREYKRAIDLGSLRIPQQQLRRIRRELDMVLKKHSPWWLRLLGAFTSPSHELYDDSAASMIDETNRSIARITEERRKKALVPPPRKLIDK